MKSPSLILKLCYCGLFADVLIILIRWVQIFLGDGNNSGILNMKAKCFANNVYWLDNTINYLAKLWNLKIERSKEIELVI
jgi:hypothetical protein